MARFETVVAPDQVSVFDARIWDFIARMVGCSVPVHVIRHSHTPTGEHWLIEMDDEDQLADFAADQKDARR